MLAPQQLDTYERDGVVTVENVAEESTPGRTIV